MVRKMEVKEEVWKKLKGLLTDELNNLDAFREMKKENKETFFKFLENIFNNGFDNGYDYALSIIAYMNSINKQSQMYQ